MSYAHNAREEVVVEVLLRKEEGMLDLCGADSRDEQCGQHPLSSSIFHCLKLETVRNVVRLFTKDSKISVLVCQFSKNSLLYQTKTTSTRYLINWNSPQLKVKEYKFNSVVVKN